MQILTNAIWRFDAFLPPNLCAAVIERAQRAGLRRAEARHDGRHNEETFLDWPTLRATVLRRLGAQARECRGLTLEASVLAPRIECYRYQAGDFIEAHRDAPRPLGPGAWSNLTLVVYLDRCASGGETVFPDHGIRVRPALGSALLFSQTLRHAAQPVLRGTKHILRTDLACPPSQRC